MEGKVASLNVSVAGAVVMYEAMRQRRSPSVQLKTPPAAQVAPKRVKERKGLGSI